MPRRRVTLQDIAEHLGLSRPTVSQALSGHGRIAKSTQERVREAAASLGYQPDPLLSAFSRHRQQGASPGSVMGLISRQALAGWQQPLMRAANRLGYLLEVFPWSDYSDQKALVNVLRARNVAGVVFIEEAGAPVLEAGLWCQIRGIQCGPYPSGRDLDSPYPIVRHNPFDSVSIVWEKAVEAGFRRIGLILPLKGKVPDSIEEKTLAAYRYRQQHVRPRQPRLPPQVVPLNAMDEKLYLEETGRWLAAQQPDLVICETLRTYHHLEKSGCRVPEDVSAIVLRKGESHPEIAGLILDRVAVIETAIFQLHTRIQYEVAVPVVHPVTIVLNPQWQAGASFQTKRGK